MLKIIAEIGINHNGNFKRIEELIRQAAIGGADFAKFQLYSSQRVFGDDSRKRNEFTFQQTKEISEICQYYGIEFFASVFDEEKLEWCKELKTKLLKVASRTLTNEKALVDKIVSTKIHTMISLGMYTSETIPYHDDHVSYFNCISKYPTGIKDIKSHKYRLYDEKIVGLSDHSYGIANCLHHVSLGANYIEKHFTLNKADEGNDHICSMTIEELKQLRELGNQIYTLR